MPVRFTCVATLPRSPEQICDQILDIEQWTSFEGYGPIPAIQSTRLLERTDQIVGTRFEVENADGSRHTEEIVHLIPGRELTMRIGPFSPPLKHLASHFVERWQFDRDGQATRVRRSFELHPKSVLTYPMIWLIARLLKKATARHLRVLAAA